VISAVVPTRGAAERLRRYLPSVRASLAASGDTWEIVVVDDGAALGPTFADVRLVSIPEPGGYGPAVNQGAAAAAGDLLLVLNDDVRLEEPTVRLMREALLSRTDAFAVAPAIPPEPRRRRKTRPPRSEFSARTGAAPRWPSSSRLRRSRGAVWCWSGPRRRCPAQVSVHPGHLSHATLR